jgi:hypothetical protein
VVARAGAGEARCDKQAGWVNDDEQLLWWGWIPAEWNSTLCVRDLSRRACVRVAAVYDLRGGFGPKLLCLCGVLVRSGATKISLYSCVSAPALVMRWGRLVSGRVRTGAALDRTPAEFGPASHGHVTACPASNPTSA